MKKTTLAKLIELLETDSSYYTENDHIEDRMYKLGLDDAIKRAKQLLEEERQNLIEAYDDGRKSMLKSSGFITLQQYFNENYQQ